MYSKWPKNLKTFSHLKHTKIYPNLDYWFEKQTIWQPCSSPVEKWDIIRFEARPEYVKRNECRRQSGARLPDAIYFLTKNTNLGAFRRSLEWKMCVYFTAIWNILLLFGILHMWTYENFGLLGIFFPVLVYCTMKNLATLVWSWYQVLKNLFGMKKCPNEKMCFNYYWKTCPCQTR
jgi:hypothetical protein